MSSTQASSHFVHSQTFLMPAPIFIVGSPRSGTTLIRLVLDSHSNIAIAPESAFLFRLARRASRLYRNFCNEAAVTNFISDFRQLKHVRNWFPKNISNSEIIAQVRIPGEVSQILNVLFTSYAKTRGKHRWGDKTPRNLQHIEEIMSLFPQARIIVIIRDCRDVVLSQKQVIFGGLSSYGSAKRWKVDAQFARRALSRYPEKIMLVRYEDFVANPENVLHRIISFVGEPWDPAILQRYLMHEDDVPHTKSELFREPIQGRNIGKWKRVMREKDVKICEAIAGDELHYFGYERIFSGVSLGPINRIFYSLTDVLRRVVNPVYLENYLILAKLIIRRRFLGPLGYERWSRRV